MWNFLVSIVVYLFSKITDRENHASENLTYYYNQFPLFLKTLCTPLIMVCMHSAISTPDAGCPISLPFTKNMLWNCHVLFFLHLKHGQIHLCIAIYIHEWVCLYCFLFATSWTPPPPKKNANSGVSGVWPQGGWGGGGGPAAGIT